MSELRISRISLFMVALLISPAHAQITWQNVYSQPAPDTSGQMEAARSSMNAGFDQFKNMINEREEIDRANWNNVKRNNTEAYLDAVYSFRTVEDLRANQNALEQKRQSYGAQIDQNVARRAFDERMSALMQQAQWARNAR